MKFVLSHDRRNISDTDLLEDMVKVAGFLRKSNLTEREYKENGKYGVTTMIRRFGGWSKATKKAGLNKTRASKIGKVELFENLEEMWIKLGRQPSYREVQKPLSKFHAASYERKFGSWRKALEEFIIFANSEDSLENLTKSQPETIKGHKTCRTINLRLRFRVMKRDCFKCQHCGKNPSHDPKTELQVDHIIPWSKGGETVLDNLQTLCQNCNLGKSNETEG